MSLSGGYAFGFTFRSERPGQDLAVAIGRNDPCPCGSGRKVKKCHLGPQPPSLISCADARLWPILVALNKNSLDYLSEILPSFGDIGFQDENPATRNQNLAIAFYACIAYRVGSAILTLVSSDQGEEAYGLRRELDDARISLAYYQSFADEATNLVASRLSNLLTFERRLVEAGMDRPRNLSLEQAAAAERKMTPGITSEKRVGHWTEPSVKDMLQKLHDAWDEDPDARHVGERVDMMMSEDKRGLSEARAKSQHAAGSVIPSQWLHNTFILSDRYIEWSAVPRLRPLSNSMREYPNRFLEIVTDSVLAVVNGIAKQVDCVDPSRMSSFTFALAWFQQVLDADKPC